MHRPASGAEAHESEFRNHACTQFAMNWPANFKEAWETAKVPELTASLKGLCIAGMGGSAIGGALCRSILGPWLKIPLETVKGYELPAWVDRGWLVVAVSYSGNTEETLRIFDTAGQRGCSRLVMTTGGQLGERGTLEKVPLIEVPAGFQPRAALPYLLAPLLKLLLQFTEGHREWRMAKMQHGLENHVQRMFITTATNIAKAIAGKLVVVYAWDQYEAVAYRWQTQLNENAKVLAFHQVLPEANHNDIVGWGGAPRGVAVIMLRSNLEPPAVQRRFELTRKLAWDRGADIVLEVGARGEDRLSQVLWLLLLGDVVSIQLANELGVEAEPVEVIESLKVQMAGPGASV